MNWPPHDDQSRDWSVATFLCAQEENARTKEEGLTMDCDVFH